MKRVAKSWARGAARLGANAFLYAFDTIVLTLCDRRPRVAYRQEKVVIVKIDGIGDFVLFLHYFELMRKFFENAEVTLVCAKDCVDLASSMPFFDNVIDVEIGTFYKNIIYRAEVLGLIHDMNFDVCVHPTHSRKFALSDAIVRATAASVRIGSSGDLSNIGFLEKRISDGYYTKLVPAASQYMSELKRNSEFTAALCKEEVLSRLGSLARLTFKKPELGPDGNYFVIFPGAGWSGRCWPPERFAGIAAKVACQWGSRPIICGSKSDAEVARAILGHLGGNAIDMTGKTSIPQMIELFRFARMVISNETSAIHIAAALGVPAVCILGGGHFGRFLPFDPDEVPVPTNCPSIVYSKMDCFGCNWNCLFKIEKGKAAPCIDRVEEAWVWQAICKLVDGKGKEWSAH
jgi:ADP-heptose:LPS heptosyltransferase